MKTHIVLIAWISFAVACSGGESNAAAPMIDSGADMAPSASRDAGVDADPADVAVDMYIPARTARWERIDNFEIAEPHITRRLTADETYLYALVLVDDTPTKSWRILRSPDEGETWTVSHEMSARAATTASFFGNLDGTIVFVMPAYTEAGMIVSTDQGETWDEVANVPAPLNKAVVRDGESYLVAGSSTHRSTDAGATWEPVTWDSIVAFVRAARFGDAFWAITEFGTLHTLADSSTTWVEAEAAPVGSDIWVAGDQLWVKTVDGPLMTTENGVSWFEQPTAFENQYAHVYRSLGAGGHWFMAATEASRLLQTSDEGRSVRDVTFNFPTDMNGRACVSHFAATTRYAVAATQKGLFDTAGCTPSADPDGGVYRFAFED